LLLLPLSCYALNNSELFRFADSMAFYESSNNPDTLIVDNKGRVFIGLFQFSYSALKDIGHHYVFATFLCDRQTFPTWMQYVCFAKLCVLNEKKTAKFKKYFNTYVHGVYLTKSSVLAACHLAGYSGFKEWLKTGKDRSDLKGTKITDYVKRFEKFDL
jgi:hypothetical protein